MRLSALFLLVVGIFGSLMGCQSPPTELHEKSEVAVQAKDEEADLFAPNTVLVDVRNSFEYLLSHVGGAVNARPQDFYQKKKGYEHLPDPDYESLARRLAMLGISPEKNVIILGNQSDDSEVKMKRLLEFLGVKKVKMRSMKQLASSKSRIQYRSDNEQIENVPMWSPTIDKSRDFSDLK